MQVEDLLHVIFTQMGQLCLRKSVLRVQALKGTQTFKDAPLPFAIGGGGGLC